MLEHRLDAGMARRVPRVRGAQQFGALAQLVGDRLARQHAHPRRGQFERQRQTFDQATDVDDGRALGRGREAGVDAAGGVDEQAHGVERFGAVVVLRVGARQALDRHRPFTRDGQAQPRGDDDLQARAFLQQAVEQRRVLGHLLEVVEHQQQLPLAPRVDGARQRVVVAGPARDAGFVREPQAELRRRLDVFERHEYGTVDVAWRELLQRAAREPCLADAARSDQGTAGGTRRAPADRRCAAARPIGRRSRHRRRAPVPAARPPAGAGRSSCRAARAIRHPASGRGRSTSAR
jgi:hypothetical protein